MRRAPFLVVLLAACVPPLDNATLVHDLRILAISADPPEFTYPAPGLGDAGPFVCEPNVEAIGQSRTVTLSALVGDPSGNGRSLHYVFTGCPRTSDEICPSGPGYLIAEGDSPAPVLSATWHLGLQLAGELHDAGSCADSAACGATPLIDAVAENPLFACRYGIWYQIGLEVDAPNDGGTIYGSTLMVFTPVPDDYPTDGGCPLGPDGGPPPHHNPALEAFDLDGEALPLDSAPSISEDYSHILRPIEPTNGPQPYCLPLFFPLGFGHWTQLTETWLYSAMTTVGAFDREQVGGAAVFGTADTGPSMDLNFTWTFPDGGAGATAQLYEITRDGRGGTSFLIRDVDIVR